MTKLLHPNMKNTHLKDVETYKTMVHEFFRADTYGWWYQVKPGDVVMDIGACIGMMTCKALDQGASKVYSIEPNIKLLHTTMVNAMPLISRTSKQSVVPINAFIGHAKHGFGVEENEAPHKTFREIIQEYDIKWIDFLKVDCEGGEYDIFIRENYDFLRNNVKHIAMEVHLDVYPDAPRKFIEFRDNFMQTYPGLVRFSKIEHKRKTFDNEYILGDWPLGWGSSWMIYFTQK